MISVLHRFKSCSALELKTKKAAEKGVKMLDVPIPLSAQVLEYMHALKINGHGKDDHGGLMQVYEKIVKIEVRK